MIEPHGNECETLIRMKTKTKVSYEIQDFYRCSIFDRGYWSIDVRSTTLKSKRFKNKIAEFEKEGRKFKVVKVTEEVILERKKRRKA